MSTDKKLLESQRFELIKFKESAKVTGVVDILWSDIQKIDAKLRSLELKSKSLEVDSVKKYRNMGTNHWYWAQDDKNVMITLMISHVDSEKMEKNILSDSVDIKFHDVEGEGKHQRFVTRQLLKEIVPGGSTVEVKEGTVRIILPKCEEGYHWSDLFKKDKNSVGASKRRNMA